MTEPLVVVGGTVAALVAAEQAAAAGRHVELLLPHKGVGGGFAPLQLGGRRLDRGLRALELRYEGVGAPPPLAAYDAAGAGHRPYARLIESYVRDLVGDDLVELDRPRQWLAGRLGDELLTTCDLTGLRAYLTDEQADTIVRQASGAAAGLLDPRHAGALEHTSIADASREQHGALFHDLVIAPLAAKLRPEGGADVPAALRRKLWLALFHPRTLREAAGGGPVGFCPDRPFHGIEPGGTGAIVTRLLERVQAAWRVTVRRVDGIQQLAADGDHVLITPSGAPALRALHPILALAPGGLFAAAGVPYAPDRVTSVMAWVEVAEDDVLELPSFLHVVDADVPVFRLSRGERRDGRVTICAELAHDVPKAEAAAVAAAALPRLGLVGEGASVTTITAFAGPTFTAPTFASRERFAAARAAYDALGLRAQAIGGSEAFGADSLNEQLVQALRAAELAAGRLARAAA
jgi:hypothetical protein